MDSGRRGEHRSRCRVALEGEFLIAPATMPKNEAWRGALRDLSCCGLGGMLDVYLPPGTMVRLGVAIKQERQQEVRGLVARCDPGGERYQIGVRFIDPPLYLRVTVSSLTSPPLRGPLPAHLQEILQEQVRLST